MFLSFLTKENKGKGREGKEREWEGRNLFLIRCVLEFEGNKMKRKENMFSLVIIPFFGG